MNRKNILTYSIAYSIVFGVAIIIVLIFNATQKEGVKFFDSKIDCWTGRVSVDTTSKIKRADIDKFRNQTWNFTHKEKKWRGNINGIIITFSPFLSAPVEYHFGFYPSGQIKWITRSTWGEIFKILEFDENGFLEKSTPDVVRSND